MQAADCSSFENCIAA